jgi:sterol desaturase/sphingolipid hydroxylase (fatty acid hydroxylase superfamily)
MVLFLTSPFMALSYKASLEGSFGKVYHTEDSLLKTLIEVLLFNMVADTWFYWVHRGFHEIAWLYERSHYLHHSAHPVNTFMGNGGDVFELITQGELQVFVPTLFVPIHARYFVLNSLLMQGFTLWLHNGKRWRLPGWVRKIVIDPFDHNIHHYFGRRNFNYALYFTVWDRLMGTHKDTVAAFEKIVDVKSPYVDSPAELENVKQHRLPLHKNIGSLPFLLWRSFKLCLLMHESPL